MLSASNGLEALDVYAAQSGRIDAVLLDMTMPVMGGEETMKHLAARWPDATVIATSGYDLEEARTPLRRPSRRLPPETLHRGSTDREDRRSGPLPRQLSRAAQFSQYRRSGSRGPARTRHRR